MWSVTATVPPSATTLLSLSRSSPVVTCSMPACLQGAGGPLEVDVRDGDDLHPADAPDLRDEAAAHLACADEPDPHGPTAWSVPVR